MNENGLVVRNSCIVYYYNVLLHINLFTGFYPSDLKNSESRLRPRQLI